MLWIRCRRHPTRGFWSLPAAGDKAFIAGADISEFEGKTAITQREAMKGRRAFDAVEDFPKPVIAMINGFCLGGGMELAMACDTADCQR